jgi:hypothetical protein
MALELNPSLPLQKGGIALFGILFLSLDRQRGGRGDFLKICLLNDGLLNHYFPRIY